MLNCKHLVDNADLLIDGTDLRPGQRVTLRAHLLICRHCRRYLRQLSLLTRHLRHRGPGPADDTQVNAVMAKLSE